MLQRKSKLFLVAAAALLCLQAAFDVAIADSGDGAVASVESTANCIQNCKIKSDRRTSNPQCVVVRDGSRLTFRNPTEIRCHRKCKSDFVALVKFGVDKECPSGVIPHACWTACTGIEEGGNEPICAKVFKVRTEEFKNQAALDCAIKCAKIEVTSRTDGRCGCKTRRELE